MLNMTVSASFDASPGKFFNAPISFLQNATNELFAAAQEVYATTTPATLAALQAPAPPVQYPLQWTSPRQKRAVMAKLKAQGNLPYQRTGRYVAGYSITLSQDAAGSHFVLANPVDYAQWVSGGMSRTGSVYQQKMHRATGWKANAPIALGWSTDVVQQVAANFAQRMRAAASLGQIANVVYS